MKPSPSTMQGSWLVLAASLLVCLGVWRWAGSIFLPANRTAAESSRRPMGNNSDLYPRWLGARELLLDRRDPYSRELTREMQVGFYGRVLDSRNPSDPKGQEAFFYPLYVVFLLAPTVTIPFSTVQDIFRWLLLLSMAFSVPLWMYAVGFRPRKVFLLAGMVLIASTYPAVLEFHMQNLAALSILFLAAAAGSLTYGWQMLSGFLLAFSTIKPEISWLIVLWCLGWAVSDWKNRKRLVWSFTATMLILFLAADLVLPHWWMEFLTAILEYRYEADLNIIRVLFPAWLAWPIIAASVGACLYVCWRWRKAPGGSIQFGWALSWVVALTIATLPKLAAYNHPLLAPALLVLIAQYKTISRLNLFSRALVKATFACQLWQWTAALALAACSFVVPEARLRAMAELPVYTFLALPPLTLLAVATVSFSGLARLPSMSTQANLPTPSGQHE